MILFQIYYISAGNNWTAAEGRFFNDVQTAISTAFNAKERGQTAEEYSNNCFLFLSKAEAKQMFKRDVATPSVAIKYRNNATAAYNVAFLKGIGKPAAWTKAAKSIFDGVPVPQSETPSGGNGDADKDANGKGKGSGSGTNSGNGLDPFRKCNPVDNFLASIGLGSWLSTAYFGGAAALGAHAFTTDNTKAKWVSGAGAAGLAYLGWKQPDPECLPSKK